MPASDTRIRWMESTTYNGDMDIGRFFLNLMLDKVLRVYDEVDITEQYAEEERRRVGLLESIWEYWLRQLIGFKPSPYICTRN